MQGARKTGLVECDRIFNDSDLCIEHLTRPSSINDDQQVKSEAFSVTLSIKLEINLTTTGG